MSLNKWTSLGWQEHESWQLNVTLSHWAADNESVVQKMRTFLAWMWLARLNAQPQAICQSAVKVSFVKLGKTKVVAVYSSGGQQSSGITITGTVLNITLPFVNHCKCNLKNILQLPLPCVLGILTIWNYFIFRLVLFKVFHLQCILNLFWLLGTCIFCCRPLVTVFILRASLLWVWLESLYFCIAISQ